MYQKTVLPSGLQILTHDMKERDSVSVGIWIGVGGRYEDDKIKGTAHYLEHILFKGSEKYSCSAIKEEIEGVGGTLNAFTSEEMTCFYAKIPSQYLKKTFDILADMVRNPLITKKDVDRERTVILEEIKMYHDLPQYHVLELLDEMLWPGHPLGTNLAGTVKSVSGLSEKNLRSFHRQYYAPNHIVVAACGDVAHSRCVQLVKQSFGKALAGAEKSFLAASRKQERPGVKFFRKDIEQMHLALGMPGYDAHQKDKYVLGLLNVILGGNMSSRLFNEVREKRGLAYSISSSAKSLQDTGVFMVRAGVDNTKIVEAVRIILKELEKISRQKVSPQEFRRARDYFLGQVILSLEDTMEHMLWIGEAIISEKQARTLKAVVRAIQQVTIGDIQRVAGEILARERYNLAIVGPITDDQKTSLCGLMGAEESFS